MWAIPQVLIDIIFERATITSSYPGHWENETTYLRNGISFNAQLHQM